MLYLNINYHNVFEQLCYKLSKKVLAIRQKKKCDNDLF